MFANLAEQHGSWMGPNADHPVARRVRLNGESKKQALHSYGVLQDPKSDV